MTYFLFDRTLADFKNYSVQYISIDMGDPEVLGIGSKPNFG